MIRTRTFALIFLAALTGIAVADDAELARNLAIAERQALIDNPNAHPLAGRTPLGHREFCRDNRALCVTAGETIRPLPVTAVPLLQSVNSAVNARMVPRFTRADAWNIATPALGDCSDSAASKLARLMAAGVPREALRFATVFTEDGIAHLVLLAWLDTGPLVLDSRRATLLPPRQTGYRFLAVEWLWGDGFYSWIAFGPGEFPA